MQAATLTSRAAVAGSRLAVRRPSGLRAALPARRVQAIAAPAEELLGGQKQQQPVYEVRHWRASLQPPSPTGLNRSALRRPPPPWRRPGAVQGPGARMH